MLTFAFIVLSFILLGIVFFRGKGNFLIAGYNTMTSQEKAQWNERALCKATGILMFVYAGCFSIVWVSVVLHNSILLIFSILLILAVTFCGMIYINTSKKFKRK